MSNTYRIVFMGTPDFSVPALKALCDNGYTPIAVYTQPDRINSRGKKIKFSPVKELALERNIPVYQPMTFKSDKEAEMLKALAPDLLVVVAYGKILPESVLRIPKYGALNIHGSLLPKYRGAAPIQRTIINGDTETGVTIMKLDAGMDTGDIISMKHCPILPTTTAGELFDSLSKMGALELIRVLRDLEGSLAQAYPQDHTQATYAEKVTKEMGHLNWQMAAKDMGCLIRGMSPNPGCYSFYRGSRVKIYDAISEEGGSFFDPGTIVSLEGGLIGVACGEGILRIKIIQPENHKKMSAAEFINGYKVQRNDKFIG